MPPPDFARTSALEQLYAFHDDSGERDLVTVATRALAAFPDDADVVVAAARALIARAELTAFDAPAPDRAAGIAERALARVVAARGDAASPALLLLHANALRLEGPAHDEEAERAFARALDAMPGDAGAWFDAGLFHKVRGRFERALEATERARALGGEDKRVLWNVAICATALGRGTDAARAWRALGLPAEVNRAGMPVVEGLPSVEVRAPSRGAGFVGGPIDDRAFGFEVVRVAPLSPCHGVVETPTLRDAPIDYGDVVVWDGAPVSVRDVGGVPVPRFPLLAILRRGDEARMRFVALEQDTGQTEALERALPDGVRVFVLEARVESICARCASGEAFTPHAHEPPDDHRVVHGKLVVPSGVDLAEVARSLDDALRPGAVKLAVPELYDALGDAARAGREHQAYRGIDRLKERRGLAGSGRG